MTSELQTDYRHTRKEFLAVKGPYVFIGHKWSLINELSGVSKGDKASKENQTRW